jgi:hypothetical protein
MKVLVRMLGASCALVLAACGFPRPADVGPMDSGNANDDAVSVDAPQPPQFHSCDKLASTCGVAGTTSCCSSTVVDGGAFYRSYDRGGDPVDTNMSFPATVSTFRLDAYEVTVAPSVAFVRLSTRAGERGCFRRHRDPERTRSSRAAVGKRAGMRI